MWPFTRNRQAGAFTDTLLNGLIAAANGTNATPEAVSATEMAAGTWARAFMAARVLPPGRAAEACTPELLGQIGRALVRRGEWLAVIAVDDSGAIRLIPSSSWTVRGEPEPESWTYRVNLAGPTGIRTRTLPAEGVVHIRYGAEPLRPWIGLSPLQFAIVTGKLSGGLESNLANEASGLTGYVIPMPQDGGAANLDKLRADIRDAKGGTTLAETTSAGYGEGRAAAPAADWQPRRIGMNVPAANVQLRSDVEACILAIHGVSPSLVQTNSDGTAQREAWRRFVFGTIEPMSRVVASELAAKLESPGVRLDFTDLRAEDIAGRSRSYLALTSGDNGMSPEDARRLVGFD